MPYRKAHVAMISSPGRSHLMPLLKVAKRLSAMFGFHITVFVLETDAAFAHSKFQDSTCVEIIDLPPPDMSGLVDPTDHLVTRTGVIMSETVATLRSKIAAMPQKPTALIIDLFGTDFLGLAREFNMLAYVLIASNARFVGVTTYYPTLDDDTKQAHAKHKKPLEIPGCQPVRYEDAMDAFLVPDEPLYQDLARHGVAYPKADGILVNTWEEMEPQSLKSLQDQNLLGRVARVPVYPIGPLCGPIEFWKTEHRVLDWLNEQQEESVLFIAFGSGGTLTTNQSTELAKGLERSKQPFVWLVRPPLDGPPSTEYLSPKDSKTKDPAEYLPKGFVTRTQDRGLVVPSWVPQAECVAHPAVGGLLTHCGWSSVLEGVVGGVPMIACPLFAEQGMNAALLCDELGIAVRVDTWKEKVSRSEIEEKIRKVMQEEEGKVMREKVKKLRSDGGGSADEWLRRFTEDCLERAGDLSRGV